MYAAKTAAALGVGLLSTLFMGLLAQNGTGQDQPVRSSTANTLVLDDLATVDWIEQSKVAALREGVIDKMELRLGDPALAGKPIGYLHHISAELAVAKAQAQADSVGAIEKGKAAFDVALATVAINHRLNERKPGMVSKEEMAKAEGELKVADAQIKEARENQKVAMAELAIAKQLLAEHTILAPFDGIVINVFKHPGESVRANEAVVQIGKLSRLCANAYVPLRHAFKVKEGQIVELQPRLETAGGSGKEEVEKMIFRGKITFVDPQIQVNVRPERRIRAEFENPDYKLVPGLTARMTIYLNDDVAARIPQPAR